MGAWLRRLLCRHDALTVAVIGAAAVSKDGQHMEVLIETACSCGLLEHRYVEITEALRRGMEGR